MRLPIDTELQTHDGSEDGEDDMDSEVIVEKLLQSREKIFRSAKHNIDEGSKRKLTIISIFQTNCRLELKFLLRAWQISREKEGN